MINLEFVGYGLLIVALMALVVTKFLGIEIPSLFGRRIQKRRLQPVATRSHALRGQIAKVAKPRMRSLLYTDSKSRTRIGRVLQSRRGRVRLYVETNHPSNRIVQISESRLRRFQ